MMPAAEKHKILGNIIIITTTNYVQKMNNDTKYKDKTMSRWADLEGCPGVHPNPFWVKLHCIYKVTFF